MDYRHITTADELQEFCQAIESAELIAFDTEFVSEDRFLPELCLLQVAADDEFAVIDPFGIDDLDCFWNLIVEGPQTSVVHAGREELRFCHRAVGKRPFRLHDVQIAAGLIGMEYPAAYRTLVSKIMGVSLEKGETRTDWRRRPLSTRQIEYALLDVLHLQSVYRALMKEVHQLSRESWFEDEMLGWQDRVESSSGGEQWRRVSGATSLSRRSLAVVRELWRWRNDEASRRDRPVRRVLRDDLIVELAKRQSSSLKRIRAIRGLNHRDVERHLPAIASAIQTAVELPESDCPAPQRRSSRPNLNALIQFLNCALATICRNNRIAPAIVGTSDDIRDLVSNLLNLSGGQQASSLAGGWRKGLVGDTIQQILNGQLAMMIENPEQEHPLVFREIES